jgi:hypothetical protein
MSVNHSEDISQVNGSVVQPETALRLLAKLISRAHVKKRRLINGESKSDRAHPKNILRGV